MKAIKDENWFNVNESEWVLVNNNTIEPDDWFYDVELKDIFRNEADDSMNQHLFPECKRIIGATDDLAGVPRIELDKVKRLAEYEFPTKLVQLGFKQDTNSELKKGFIAGYNKHAELYKFTEEDLGDIIQICDEMQSSPGGITPFKVISKFNELVVTPTIEFKTYEEGKCNCDCHDPGTMMLHTHPCCYPTTELEVDDNNYLVFKYENEQE